MNERQNIQTSWIKFAIGWLVVLAFRLIPFRPPNVEPIFATLMPFSKRYGAAAGFVFGALSIALLDLLVGKVGLWTLVTAVAYGLLGVFAYYMLRKRRGVLSYVVTGVLGTILYDMVTGLSVGPLFFGQPFREALIGQIPFTLMHVAGTIAFSLTISSLLEKWIIEKPVFETDVLAQKLGFSQS